MDPNSTEIKTELTLGPQPTKMGRNLQHKSNQGSCLIKQVSKENEYSLIYVWNKYAALVLNV